MTDYTSQLLEGHQADVAKQEYEESYYSTLEAEETAAEMENLRGRMTSATDKLDMSAAPDPLDFDYEAEYLEGNGLKETQEGGVQLRMKNFREGGLSIAGHDFATGEQVFKGPSSEMVKEGMDGLRELTIDTKNGPDFSHAEPLSKIAYGFLEQGSSYEDFVQNVPAVWSDTAKAIAWQTAQTVDRTIRSMEVDGMDFASGSVDADIDQMIDVADAQKWFEVETQALQMEESIEADIIDGIDETELMNNPTWMKNVKTLMNFLKPWEREAKNIQGTQYATEGKVQALEAKGQMFENMDPADFKEINNEVLWLMSMIKFNVPQAMMHIRPILESGDPEVAKAFVYLLKQYDASALSANQVGRALAAVATDPVSWATMGSGIIATRIVGNAVKEGIKRAAMKVAAGMSVDAAMGAVEAAGVEAGIYQAPEVAAGMREGIDAGQVATAGALGAAGVAVLGGVVNAAADPFLRRGVTDAARKGWNNMKKPMTLGPRPGGPVSVRGSIGVKPEDTEFVSRLGSFINDNVPDDKPISVGKLKEMVRKHNKNADFADRIEGEEVTWSRVLSLPDDAKVTKAQVMEMLSGEPMPQIKFSEYNQYTEYSLPLQDTKHKIAISYIDTGMTPAEAGHYQRMTGGAQLSHVRYDATLRDVSDGKGMTIFEIQPEYTRMSPIETGPAGKGKERQAAVMSEEVRKKSNELQAKAEKERGKVNRVYVEAAARMKKEGLIAPDANIDPRTDKRVSQYIVDDSELSARAKKAADAEAKANRELDELLLSEQERLIGEADNPFVPFMSGNSSVRQAVRTAVAAARQEGADYIYIPKDKSVVNAIQHYSEELIPDDYPIHRIYEKTLPEMFRKYGFKVEEASNPAYKNGYMSQTDTKAIEINGTRFQGDPDFPDDYDIITSGLVDSGLLGLQWDDLGGIKYVNAVSGEIIDVPPRANQEVAYQIVEYFKSKGHSIDINVPPNSIPIEGKWWRINISGSKTVKTWDENLKAGAVPAYGVGAAAAGLEMNNEGR